MVLCHLEHRGGTCEQAVWAGLTVLSLAGALIDHDKLLLQINPERELGDMSYKLGQVSHAASPGHLPSCALPLVSGPQLTSETGMPWGDACPARDTCRLQSLCPQLLRALGEGVGQEVRGAGALPWPEAGLLGLLASLESGQARDSLLARHAGASVRDGLGERNHRSC